MKEVPNMSSHTGDLTLTVAELKAVLAKFPDDMPVVAEWEGIYTPFRGIGFRNPFNGEVGDYVDVDDGGKVEKGGPGVRCLVFHVDQ